MERESRNGGVTKQERDSGRDAFGGTRRPHFAITSFRERPDSAHCDRRFLRLSDNLISDEADKAPPRSAALIQAIPVLS